MDIRNKKPSMRGKTHWAGGYEIKIGPDGMARNIPSELGAKLLGNTNVWELVYGGEAVIQSAKPVVTTKIVDHHFLPQAKALLEATDPMLVELVAPEFGVTIDAEFGQDKAALIDAIFKAADTNLVSAIEGYLRRKTEAILSPSATPEAVQDPEPDPDPEPAEAATTPEVPTPEPRKRGRPRKDSYVAIDE